MTQVECAWQSYRVYDYNQILIENDLQLDIDTQLDLESQIRNQK